MNFNTSQNENNLLALLHKRDKIAFDKLYDTYAPTLYGILTRMVHDRAEVDRLTQLAFLRIWERIPYFDSSTGSLCSWIIAITKGVVFEHDKEKQPAKEKVDDLLEHSCDKNAESETTRLDAQTHLELSTITGKLSPEELRLIEMAYYGRLTVDQVSSQMKLSPVAIRLMIRSIFKDWKQHSLRLR